MCLSSFNRISSLVIYSITSNSGPTQLSVVLDTTVTATATRQWNIRVLQYECSSRNLGIAWEHMCTYTRFETTLVDASVLFISSRRMPAIL